MMVIPLIIAEKVPVLANTNSIVYMAQTSVPPGISPNDVPPIPLPAPSKKPLIEPLPPLEEFLEILPNQLPEAVPESEIEFEVTEFELKGNTVLEAAAVEAVLQEYRDRPITFADLLELEARLTKLYTAEGYINSGVVVPAQNIARGVVTLRAIEGMVEEITVDVEGRLKENYIRSRLARGAKSPLNVEELREALQLLQLDPLVESLSAELSVGLSRDRWILDVDVNQDTAFAPLLFVNNSRTPSVGSFQQGIELNHNNVLGYGERLSLIFKNTAGSDDYDSSYSVPVNSLNGTIGLRYRYISSDIIEGNLAVADIESQTDEFRLTLRQPILVSANSESTQEFALGLEASRQTNQVTVQNQPFPLPFSGADVNGETKISALRFFQDWTRRTRTDVLAARSQLSAGFDIFDATVNENAPDSKFVAWRGQVQWLRQLSSSDINLLLRSDVQLSSDDLVPLERFSLGGVESVRGYRQDALLGDNGVFASAEVRIPFYRWNNGQNSLSAIPFVDFGTTWSNSNEREVAEDTVASLGLGIRLSLSNRLNARVDYGIPLIEVIDNNDTLQENGVYFAVEYFPF
ncbi:ShlB/FhaC/HecB family hemolysin secretion/activation protein [Pleurocapsales cyanobacterium LEGE 10410]|nr:ShlB/FhaC/HecB family hemolysin secretion/activation protein [Pleurocapsales cyanobacterium LEGE 10410]